MSSRAQPDFINAFLKYTENSESPRSYHLWSAVGVVAGALQRRCWMKWGHTILYPNQYIVLVGPSGNRKGEPIMIARELLSDVGITLISEAITRQALIRSMQEAVESYQDGKGVRMQCPVTGVFEELAVFLGEGDANFLASMTNWYDSRDKWTYQTKNAGTDQIVGVCMNMLAGTAPDWIPLVIPHSALGGGFTSRIFFIVEDRKGKIITNPNAIAIDYGLKAALIHDLEEIRSITGEYRFDRAALALYEQWYLKQEEGIAQGHLPIKDPRFAGYIARRATHVKKLAMVSAASRGNALEVTENDFTRALDMMEAAEQSMPAVFTSVGRSLYSVQTDTVMEFIRVRGECTRSELMKLLYYDIDVRTLEVVEENLRAMQVIDIVRDAGSGDTIYTWVG